MSTHDLFERPAATRIRVGIGGWTYAPWRDNFYPHKLVQRRELEYASRHVTSIEVNGTYYGAQKPATYAKWRVETPDGFVFSLKAPRHVTERARLADAGGAIDAFVGGGLAELGDRLGPINWQFAKGRPFERDDFAAFLDRLPASLNGSPLRHVVEVRDALHATRADARQRDRHRLVHERTHADHPAHAVEQGVGERRADDDVRPGELLGVVPDPEPAGHDGLRHVRGRVPEGRLGAEVGGRGGEHGDRRRPFVLNTTSEGYSGALESDASVRSVHGDVLRPGEPTSPGRQSSA